MRKLLRPKLLRPRSLRHSVLAWLALGFLLLTGAQYYLSGNFIAKQLLEIEAKDAFARLRDLRHALEVLKGDLAVTTSDWAQWDSTYAFVSDANPDYPANHIYPVTFARLRLSLVLISDSQGRVLFAKTVSEDGNALIDVPAELEQALRDRGLLHGRSPPTDSVTGLIESPAGLFLVSSQPVRNSAGDAPPRGRLIMGRALNRYVEPVLEEMVGESLEVAGADAFASHGTPEASASRGRDSLVVHAGELIASTPLDDVSGTPVAQLQVSMERPIEGMLVEAQQHLLLASLIVGVLFCVAGLMLIRWKVVAPLERLAAAVETIGEGGHSAARVPVEHASREFGTLSSAINAMLQQLEQQQAMQRDRDAALEANRLKSEFLATMSHEIRTPMNGVLGMCELLQRTDLEPRQRHLSDTILRSARSLLDILNDILDFSKIESGRLELENAAFSPAETVQTTSAPFIAAAQAKGIEFSVRMEPGIPPLLMGDALRLKQILGNLLSNALKFTHKGSVSVACAPLSIGPDHAELRFAVADTGIGMTPAAQQCVFEPFAQAEAGTSRRYGGTGLGLAIVRRLVTLMGGRIETRSEVGRGSTFTFTVVLRRTPEQAIARAILPDATGPRFSPAHAPSILLAEDNAVNREVVTEMLEYFGCRVTSVENGALALAAASRTSFDVVLMDCHMPVMDGHAATGELRALERAGARKRAYIIALTADATPENRRRCLDAGMDTVTTKPISQATLRNLIFQAVRAGTASSHPARPFAANRRANVEADIEE